MIDTLGEQARFILNSDAWKRAIEQARGACHAAWESEEDPTLRDEQWWKLKAISDVEGELKTLLNKMTTRQRKER